LLGRRVRHPLHHRQPVPQESLFGHVSSSPTLARLQARSPRTGTLYMGGPSCSEK
jgi:hypothetical protein